MTWPAAEAPPPILHLLAHDIRWNVVRLLAHSDYRVNELVTLLQKPLNVVSYHLRQLRLGQLVHEQRSAADGRDVYYALNLAQLDTLYAQAAATLHPGLAAPDPAAHSATTVAPPVRVLFLCTQNSARSQMAEALLRHMGGNQVHVASAGTEPGTVHPLALQTLANHSVVATGLISKHLDTFAGQDFDYIVTVCDRAREHCPIFPGDPARIHWSFADPAAIDDPAAAVRAFEHTFRELQTRLRYVLTRIMRDRRGR